MLIVSFMSPDIGLVANFRHFEGVPVQMNRVLVAAVIVDGKPVPLTLLHGEKGIGVRP